MQNQNLLSFITKKLIFESIKHFFLMPLWWYSEGLIVKWNNAISLIEVGNQTIGVSIWLKSLFRPMYGQRDIAGRLISVLLRVVVALFKISIFLLWIFFSVVGFIVWVALPPFIISQIVYQVF